MASNNENNNDCCKCTTPEYELILNEQGPQGRQGKKGEAGFTPIISVKDNTDSNYTLNILTQDGQITTPNLKANLPAGGATGQVLTKNSANQDDCSWQNLPNATTEVEGIARLATEEDFETTEDSSVSNTTIVTPALFNTEFEKKSTNFVTIDTVQSIDASKTFLNGLFVHNNLTIPYNSNRQNGKIVTNAILNDVRIPIVEPYDVNGSFRIGAVKEEASEDVQNGFDINNDWISGAQGVTYYEVGQKGKLVASFNIDKYVKAGNNVTINKGSDGSLTINSTGGGEIPTNVVTTNTDQNINATKVFYGVSPIQLYNENYWRKVTPVIIWTDTVYGNKILIGDCPDSGASTAGIPVVLTTARENKNIYKGFNGDLSQFYPLLDTENFSSLAPTGNLKYWTGTSSDYDGIDNKDIDTLYRTTDTDEVYLGSIKLGGNSGGN